jgi:hypothetical protein
MTKGDAMTGGIVMEKMVSCPLCKGGGCAICRETGVVKQANVDRARDGGWVGFGPTLGQRWREHRAKKAWVRKMLEQYDSELSRLDREDRRERGLG